MKRSQMKNLIKILTFTTLTTGAFSIVLGTERAKYEEAISENIILKTTIEGVYNSNNRATYKHYEELEEGVKYKIVLNDGTYAIIDRGAEKYELYIKYIKPYVTSLDSEEALLEALESYITAHKYVVGE